MLGDIVAGIAATNLRCTPSPTLFVDIGTNGEIVIHPDERFVGCATAAGPAFEGAGLSHGVRAGRGAIDRIEIDREPFALWHRVIGDAQLTQPRGLCGTAYLDFLAQARAADVLTPSGRFADPPPPKAKARLHTEPGYGQSFRIVGDVRITEADIALLLQAQAAIAAGILTLLGHVGLEPADVQRVYFAGGFGVVLDAGNTVAAGLLPGFTPDQIEPVGNTSLAGAYLALMDRSVLADLRATGRDIEPVELNQSPGFEDRYLDAMVLP
ncbi:MAG: ASKHA domain-containing protein [Planctomycetota bacterium]